MPRNHFYGRKCGLHWWIHPSGSYRYMRHWLELHRLFSGVPWRDFHHLKYEPPYVKPWLWSDTLREHFRTNETFTVDQIIRDFLRTCNYYQFSIKSYVLAIYYNRLGEAVIMDHHNMNLWRNIHFFIVVINPRVPPFLLYVSWKTGETFVRRCFPNAHKAKIRFSHDAAELLLGLGLNIFYCI